MILAAQERPEMHVDKNGPRLDGAVRLAATSERGGGVESLALDGHEVVAGDARRLDVESLAERPPRPLPPPPRGAMVLEDGERLLAQAPAHAVALSARTSAAGDEVRLHHVPAGKWRGLAVGQRAMRAGALSPDGKAALVLDDEGRVLSYDLTTFAYPGSASTRKPLPGRPACLGLARGGRLWLAASGASLEVRVISDLRPVATVDLSPLDDEVTSALFLPDATGLLVGTARGLVLRFELLVDVVGTSREARMAAITDAVDAAMTGSRWFRVGPRVEIYDERTADGRTILSFVADHSEWHQVQSGSDWEEHVLCAGHATFEGDRLVDVVIATKEQRMIMERDAESWDQNADFAAFRAETVRRGALSRA